MPKPTLSFYRTQYGTMLPMQRKQSVPIARAIGTDENDVAGALFDLTTSLDVPTSLAEIGMKQSDLDEAAEQATKNPYYNPRSIDQQSIRQLFEYAFKGKRPIKGMEIKGSHRFLREDMQK